MNPRPRAWPFALSLLLSGAAALTYQVVWVRELAATLGTTLEAVSAVLGAFMLGLGLGGALAARTVDRMEPSRLPRVYAALEAGIAAFAVVFPGVLTAFSVHLPIVPAILLVLPTTLMGATLPLSVAIVERRAPRDAGRSAGLLYAANTVGAVAGSLATSILLLPWTGMKIATLIAAALNVVAAAVVVTGVRVSPVPIERVVARAELGAFSRIALGIAALSGFAALVSEVAWTRSLVLLIGPTSYGFSFVVSSVIFGIALGSAAAARLRRREDLRVLAGAQVGAALTAIAVVQILGKLPIPAGEIVHRYADRPAALLGLQLAAIAVLLLPTSFFLGATFPLAVSVVGREGAAPGQSTGSTLAWNTAGAILGSLAAGFLLIPEVGAERALYAAAGIHVAAAGLGLWPSRFVLVLAGLTASAPLVFPRWDRELMTGGLYKYASYLEPGEFLDFLRQGDLVYDREDQVATVAVRQVGSKLSLAIDGKVDATSSADMMTQRLLAHVPLLLHHEPKRVLVIGLGSGVTAGSALTHPVESVVAVEISPAVAEASKLFAEVNHRPEADSRFELVVGDGRRHLLASREPYDVIISEPSNPWMAGVSSLFTREFFALARERLATGGLLCQWAHIYNLSGEDLRTIVAGFTDAFESSALFLLSESDVLLVGAKGTLPSVSASALDRRMGRDRVRAELAEVGVRGSFGLGTLLAASTPPLSAWAGDAERHTDDRPILEFRAARSLHRETSRENRRAIESAGIGERVLAEDREASAEDLLARAEALEGAESFEWAFQTFASSLATGRRLDGALDGLVRTAIRTDRVEEAERILRSAGEMVSLGVLYRRAGRFGDALEAVDAALRLEPESRAALVLGADVSSDRGDLAAMAAFAERLLASDRTSGEAASLLAEVRLRQGDLEGAARESAAILARHPDQARALQVHAVSHAELGNENLARESFEKILARAPEDWVQLNNLGMLELSSGNEGRAAEMFERAVDANPRNLEGYRGLEKSALAIGDVVRLERARAMIQFLSKQSNPMDPRSDLMEVGPFTPSRSIPTTREES